jgi:hypothetical protein
LSAIRGWKQIELTGEEIPIFAIDGLETVFPRLAMKDDHAIYREIGSPGTAALRMADRVLLVRADEQVEAMGDPRGTAGRAGKVCRAVRVAGGGGIAETRTAGDPGLPRLPAAESQGLRFYFCDE